MMAAFGWSGCVLCGFLTFVLWREWSKVAGVYEDRLANQAQRCAHEINELTCNLEKMLHQRDALVQKLRESEANLAAARAAHKAGGLLAELLAEAEAEKERVRCQNVALSTERDMLKDKLRAAEHGQAFWHTAHANLSQGLRDLLGPADEQDEENDNEEDDTDV